MIVQELIDELNKVEDKTKEVLEYNPDTGDYDTDFLLIIKEQQLAVHVTVI